MIKHNFTHRHTHTQVVNAPLENITWQIYKLLKLVSNNFLLKRPLPCQVELPFLSLCISAFYKFFYLFTTCFFLTSYLHSSALGLFLISFPTSQFCSLAHNSHSEISYSALIMQNSLALYFQINCHSYPFFLNIQNLFLHH